MLDPVAIQRAYYAQTASAYEQAHGGSKEHQFALAFMVLAMEQYNWTSVLDIGSGTGRALNYLKHAAPSFHIVGIEPSAALRSIGHSNGIPAEDLIDGDAQKLCFDDSHFDLVCEFGALHHIPRPDLAVSEMLRVARRAIFISDSNNFGQGGGCARFVKQAINAVGLWPVADWIKTRGRGYTISEGDGLAYSYSVFNDWKLIRAACRFVHVFSISDCRSSNAYRGAAHVAIIGIK